VTAPVSGGVPPDSTDDAHLVDRVRHGDAAAFELLYRRYWTRLYEYCFRYVQSADEAADIVQDVFFRIWRGREEWRVTGTLAHYLYISVRNRAFDRLEHAAVVQRWCQGAQADAGTLAQASVAADEVMQAGELAAAVERVLAEMPERRRAVCMLRWVDGLTYAEIAARLGIAEKTVETQIARGLRSLRDGVAHLRG
jgi:RNA polymerase sigma-70 factor (ECF subfamily)